MPYQLLLSLYPVLLIKERTNVPESANITPNKSETNEINYLNANANYLLHCSFLGKLKIQSMHMNIRKDDKSSAPSLV